MGIFSLIGDIYTSGAGLAMIRILAYGTGGTMISYVLSAFNKGQAANLVKLLTAFACIGEVLAQAFNVLAKLGKFLGMG